MYHKRVEGLRQIVARLLVVPCTDNDLPYRDLGVYSRKLHYYRIVFRGGREATIRVKMEGIGKLSSPRLFLLLEERWLLCRQSRIVNEVVNATFAARSEACVGPEVATWKD
jgi:hypothetical protein